VKGNGILYLKAQSSQLWNASWIKADCRGWRPTESF